MREVEVVEAKSQFGTLLDRFEDGEEVTITLRGQVVARLVPNREGHGVEVAREAAAGIRAMSEGATLGRLSIKELIGEGRR